MQSAVTLVFQAAAAGIRDNPTQETGRRRVYQGVSEGLAVIGSKAEFSLPWVDEFIGDFASIQDSPSGNGVSRY